MDHDNEGIIHESRFSESRSPDQASYLLLREVEGCIEAARALPGLPKEPLQELREKIDSHAFNLVVMGEFKRGKSSVINVLIGANLLPIGVIPVPAIATVLSYGERATGEVIFQNGEHRVPYIAW